MPSESTEVTTLTAGSLSAARAPCCSAFSRALSPPRRRAPRRSRRPSCSCACSARTSPTSRRATGSRSPRRRVFNYIGGYQIGYPAAAERLGSEPGNFQTAALTITGVPDGQPTQPSNTPPYCIGQERHRGHDRAGRRERVQFEGNGTYSISVSVGDDPPAPAASGGPATTAARSPSTPTWRRSWSASRSRSARKPLPGDPFVGIRAADPPGGFGDNICALDATVAAGRVGDRAQGRAGGLRAAAPDRSPRSPSPAAGRASAAAWSRARTTASSARSSARRGRPRCASTCSATSGASSPTIVRPRRTRPTFDVDGPVRRRVGGRQGHAQAAALRPLRASGRATCSRRLANYTGDVRRQGPREVPRQAPAQAPATTRRPSRSAARTSCAPGTDPTLILLGAPPSARSGSSGRSAYPRC